LKLARLLTDATGVPIAVLNGAEPAVPLSHFRRPAAEDVSRAPWTNYARLQARVAGSGALRVRALVWHQVGSISLAHLNHY
jgi:hypothetical protein